MPSPNSPLAEQAKLFQRSQSLYQRLAPDYDRHLLKDCNYQLPSLGTRLLVENLPARGLWLDLGAGTGLVGRELWSRGQKAELVAVDASLSMLLQIRSPNYTAWSVADASQPLPLAPGTFDGACALGLLEHIVDPGAVLAEVGRVLRPGAHLLLSFPVSSSAEAQCLDEELGTLRHQPSRVLENLEHAGFSVKRRRTVAGYESYGEAVRSEIVLAQRLRQSATP